MIIDTPIVIPLMTIEERLDFIESRKPKLSDEEFKKHWESKPKFPNGVEMSQWVID